MKISKLKFLSLNLFLIFSFHIKSQDIEIQKNIPADFEMPTENLSSKAYEVALVNWEACLVDQIIKEKTKHELYYEIRGKNIQTGIFEGIDATISSKYLSSKALRKILTDEELIRNLKVKDHPTKFNSFLAIAERNHPNTFKILKELIYDTTKINTQIGCIVEEITFSDLCINIVTEIYSNNYSGYKIDHYQLTKMEKEELDKLILNSNLELEYRNRIEK